MGISKRSKQFIQYMVQNDGNRLRPAGEITLDNKINAGIYTVGADMQGLFIDVKDISTDSLLRLPDTKSDEIVAELAKFWTLGGLFKKYGFIHKRGFLMYGPPGSGKTSTINQICEHMVSTGGIVVYGDGNPALLLVALRAIREIEPEKNIVVVLEDFDTLISLNGEAGYLALLDGDSSVPGVAYVATTNYINRLPDRIKNRPSRFDRTVEIGMPSLESRMLYLESRKLGEKRETLQKWAEASEGLSIAHLKEIVIGIKCLGNTIEQVMERMNPFKVTSEMVRNGVEIDSDEDDLDDAEDPDEALENARYEAEYDASQEAAATPSVAVATPFAPKQ